MPGCLGEVERRDPVSHGDTTFDPVSEEVKAKDHVLCKMGKDGKGHLATSGNLATAQTLSSNQEFKGFKQG